MNFMNLNFLHDLNLSKLHAEKNYNFHDLTQIYLWKNQAAGARTDEKLLSNNR